MVSAWTMVTRLIQCVALMFFFHSLDWTVLEKTMLRWVGIL